MQEPLNDITLHKATWFGLIQMKVASIKKIDDIIDWIYGLQEGHIDIPAEVKHLLDQYEGLASQKDLLFPNLETAEAKLILFKDHLMELAMSHYPMETDLSLRQHYIEEFSLAIPGLESRWEEEVEFRQGDDSLAMLFATIAAELYGYDDKILIRLFQLIDEALRDSHAIVQGEITRALLMNFIRDGLISNKYKDYMAPTTLAFCQKIGLIWFAEPSA